MLCRRARHAKKKPLDRGPVGKSEITVIYIVPAVLALVLEMATNFVVFARGLALKLSLFFDTHPITLLIGNAVQCPCFGIVVILRPEDR